MTAPGDGILAIWNACVPGREPDYEHWYQSEHLMERVGIPGFRVGRRFEALAGEPRFFTYYETDSPAVLRSAPYRARVNEPTDLTCTVMNEMFVDMNRTVCRCVERRGRIRGALLVVARWAGGETTSTRALEALAPRDASATTTSEIWVAVDDGSEPSAEERLRAQAAGRARDARVAACLVVSALREADARAAAIAIGEAAPEAELGIYRQLCELRHEDLARGPG